MPPEKLAYALARYSRSPDSITESMEWVRTHDSSKFLESFYFQYGHASIADLGHIAVCFEGVSELAATEIEDEQLWDGQARSSRYQDFASSEAVLPPELSADESALYAETCGKLLAAYRTVQANATEHLQSQLPRPEAMKPDAYHRNIAARAFDIARYLLPFGIPTGVGQVTSIRTLEKQIRRLKASEFAEVREIGAELSRACAAPAECGWNVGDAAGEPVAPTLARHSEPDETASRLGANVREWAADHLPQRSSTPATATDLISPSDHVADICATLLFPVTRLSYRELYEITCSWPQARRQDLLKLAVGTRAKWDDLPRHFRNTPYVFEFVMDIGAYRDLHRHRRCQQLRQPYTNQLGYDIPEPVRECGVLDSYTGALKAVDQAIAKLPQPAAQYLLPFAARGRFLFKMDFAEIEYIARLRSGVKGHFSYRRVAWEMKGALDKLDPVLGALIEATPPWVTDPLKR
jgi:thymidylate synthase ThyX